MSQQEQPTSQPTVRHIPIFVEGRSEPLVNKVPESQPSRDSSTSSMPEPPPLRKEMPSHNTSDFFKQHGSIFDRARDFPVRTFPNSSFFSNNPARESSPARQVPVFTDGGQQQHHAATSATVPPSQQRGSSLPRQTPSPPTAAQQQAQYQAQQAQRFQQHQQEQQAAAAAASKQQPSGQDHTDSRAGSQPPPPQPPQANDPISKIQKIQRDVLDIFDQVERFQGAKEGKRDKQYIYLDEMLTQNLLKLDSIDAEDQPQIKSARREAIKSINHCIAVLEAKAEAGAVAAASPSSSTGHVQGSASSEKVVPNGTADRTGSGASLSHSSSNSSSQQQPQQ